ncbi:MAG: type VI secretion system membrane subunit TssM [candidate division Zixibacteria bacterium]|nr:type VI secretion system membrane subunit TssM [candidate division Zixibacteria bacterium]
MLIFILSFLKSKLAAFGAVVVIIILIAIGGPMVLGARWRLWCYLAAAGILLLFLLYLLFKAWRARKNARLLEGFLKKQADDQLISARPDVKDELAAIKKKLDSALSVLKRSKLARGRRGDQALYVLPWYMIIGPSAAGKSTALRNSGLHFPPVDPDAGEAGKVKGLGGTRNCDWWFSSEGVILDTAGRYTQSDSGADDREEWGNFLTMLKRARRQAPINGLILAVAASEVLAKDDEGRRELAKNLRSRVDELILKLEILFPVYVVFTKCDLVEGFVDFFGDYTQRQREQVWGYTRRYEAVSGSVHTEFAQELGRLQDVLEERRLSQLKGEIRAARRRGTYLFPLEFSTTCRILTGFVETLFTPNPYHQNPLVRGFYFTSGTQEGTPIGQVMAAMRRQFGLGGGASAAAPAPTEPKAYFIKDLFGEIILPDDTKVLPTTGAGRRLRTTRMAWIGGVATAALLLTIAFLISYANNRGANADLAYLAEHVAAATKPVSGFSAADLDSLDQLRESLEQFERGPGLWRRFGLYSGDVVVAGARDIYCRRYKTIFLEPTARHLEPTLQHPPSPGSTEETERYIRTGTAYQILTLEPDAVPNEPSTLSDVADSLWLPQAHDVDPAEFGTMLRNQVHYYMKHRHDPELSLLRVEGDRALLTQIEEVIRNAWDLPRLYRLMIVQANDALGPDYTAAQGNIWVSGGSIGLAYTKKGWEDEVKKRIDTMPNVIAANPTFTRAFSRYSSDQIREKLTDLYASEFRTQWRSLLQNTTFKKPNDLTDAMAMLVDLAANNTPILAILTYLYDQSGVDIGRKYNQEIKAEFQPLGVFLGAIKTDGGGDPGFKTYLGLLGQAPEVAKTARDALAQEAKCALHLHQLKSALEERQTKTKKLMSGTSMATAAAGFLIRPLEGVAAAAYGEVCNCLNQQWENRVQSKFQPLESGYPFTKSSDRDASIPDVVMFFGTSGPIASFEDDEAKPAERDGLHLSGAYDEAMRAAHDIQQVVSGTSIDVRVKLTTSTDLLGGQFKLVRLTCGSDLFEFGNGPPQTSREIRLPRGGGQDASLYVEPKSGYANSKNQIGDWAMLRLLDDATITGGSTLNWEFTTDGGQRVVTRMALGGSGAGFILSGHFSRFHCPARICP